MKNIKSFLLLLIGVMCFATASLITQYRVIVLEKKYDEMLTKIKATQQQQRDLVLYRFDGLSDEYNELSNKVEEYASETDAKIETMEVDVEELKLEKEVNEVELHQEVKKNMTYIGNYELTAYAWTGNPCANGNYPTCGYTVACNSLPLGTKVYIEGYGDYIVEDRGGMPNNVIDVYMGDHNTCVQFGRRSAKIYVYE